MDFYFEIFKSASPGHEAVVAALLAAGADKNAATQDSVTPLHLAAQNGHEAVVAALLAAGADKERGHHEAVVAALLAAGGDKNAVRQCGATPLHCAVQ